MKKVMLFDLSRGKLDIVLLTSRGIIITDNFSEIEGVTIAAGDGGILHTINDLLDDHPELFRKKIPIFGINFGTVGFLASKPTPENMDDLRSDCLEFVETRMLQAEIAFAGGETKIVYAFNDFYMENIKRPEARIRLAINREILFDPLCGNGVIICSPGGSTAYSFNAGGPILDLESRDMLITGICVSRVHNWRTTGLNESAKVTLEPLETDFRPVRFVGDDREYENVARAIIGYSDIPVVLAFAKSEKFRERRRGYQFGKPLK